MNSADGADASAITNVASEGTTAPFHYIVLTFSLKTALSILMALLRRSLEIPSNFCCFCSNSTKEIGFIKLTDRCGGASALNLKARFRVSKDCCDSGEEGVARPSKGVSKKPPRVDKVEGGQGIDVNTDCKRKGIICIYR